MREIKFRGMSLQGDWHIGNLAILKHKVGVAEPGSYISNNLGVPFAYEIRPETVGQFTGLLDKKSKEIFEGDILDITSSNSAGHIMPDKYKVVFRSGGFYIERKSYDETVSHYLGEIPNGNVKVIGNIYENPELLTNK